jgi:hypothetical protein
MKRMLFLAVVCLSAFGQNPQTAKFPTSVAADVDLPPQVSRFQTTLGADITSSTTSGIVLGTTTGLLTQTILTIDTEQMMVCEVTDATHIKVGKSSCANTDGRGLSGGTAAASHSSLSNTKLVSGYFVAAQFNQAAAEIKAIETWLNGRGKVWSCQTGQGDGLNAMTAGTYLQSNCWNDTGVTVTLTSLQCYTDNAGSSTMNVATGAASTALLTGAVTCSSTIASGTQSGTTTLASGDFLKFTFVADGTSKQTTWRVAGTK